MFGNLFVGQADSYGRLELVGHPIELRGHHKFAMGRQPLLLPGLLAAVGTALPVELLPAKVRVAKLLPRLGMSAGDSGGLAGTPRRLEVIDW